MLTGLVQAIGTIERVEPAAGNVSGPRCVRIVVQAAGLPRPGPGIGDSVSVSGCCLTATAVDGTRFHADVSAETLHRTVNLDRCGTVNLELSLSVGDHIGGHLVSGHVDAPATVARLDTVGESRELVVRAPRSLAPLLAVKGSVAVDGVSLTINAVRDLDDGCEVSINLIPHTLSVTTLGQLAPGHRVNLEVDQLARYVQRMLSWPAARGPERPPEGGASPGYPG
jgi:riboflavin synthase